jgi:restriction system protein
MSPLLNSNSASDIAARRRAAREIERLQREGEHERLAIERERTRLFDRQQEEEAESRNRHLAEAIKQVSRLLADAVGKDHRLKLDRRVEQAPSPEDYRPKPPGFLAGLIPGAKGRHQHALREARARFDADVAAHEKREKLRLAALQGMKALLSNYEAGGKGAVQRYCEAVLSRQSNPLGWPKLFKIAFVPESKQLVVEYDFPGFDIISEVASFKYVKSKKQITEINRSEVERKRLYATMIAQGTLRVIHVLFNADYADHVESIVSTAMSMRLIRRPVTKFTPAL